MMILMNFYRKFTKLGRTRDRETSANGVGGVHGPLIHFFDPVCRISLTGTPWPQSNSTYSSHSTGTTGSTSNTTTTTSTSYADNYVYSWTQSGKL